MSAWPIPPKPVTINPGSGKNETPPDNPGNPNTKKVLQLPTNFNRIATVLILLVVVITGAIVTIVHPATLSFTNYIKSVATAVGLLAVALGLDHNSTP